MSCISSNNNRFYAELESAYGTVPTITEDNRIPTVSLAVRHRAIQGQRRDKTGSRTYVGSPAGVRTKTTFELETYMTSWQQQSQEPSQGPLFQAALGGAATLNEGATVANVPNPNQLTFTVPHNLVAGAAVSFGSDIRFVEAVVDAATVQLNAPFSILPSQGSILNKTIVYSLGESPSSVSVYDYWSPQTAVQRILSGAAVEKLQIKVNGDFHSFVFSGEAGDVVDSATFANGQGGLTTFPAEPEVTAFDYSVIPGHLGEAWLGSTATQFFTLTDAEVTIENNLDLRNREFGSNSRCCITAGQRNVTLKFNLFQQDDAQTTALYQAAKERSPISAFFQLGQQSGQLFGVYMKSVLLEVPEFNDKDTRVEWQFSASRAQGTVNDELFVAFA
jgi:hypothetical protein